MQRQLSRHWFHMTPEEVARLLDVEVDAGLDLFEVKHRTERFGANRLTPKRKQSAVTRFLLQFHNPLIYILLAAAVITATVKREGVDAAIILAVVLINAVISYLQEAKAEKAIEALIQSMDAEATVLRAGRILRISAVELIPGDIVLLKAGDRVPADVRLVRSKDLQVAEAALTGESVPVEKSAEAILAPETPIADRRNMAFTSTLITHGQGTGIVTATGDDTEIGRISELIGSAREIATPLTRKIAAFSHLILYAVVALAAATFGVGLLRGQSAIETFTAAVALAVAAIPEGLPAALTVTLAIGVSRMARRRAIIRKLPAVETLGSVTDICSDKTGTLTKNEMTVKAIAVAGEDYTVSGTGYDPVGAIQKARRPRGVARARRCPGDAARGCALQRQHGPAGRGPGRDPGRPHRDRAGGLRSQGGHRRGRAAGAVPAPRRGAVRLAAPIHGDPARHAGRRRASSTSRGRRRCSSSAARRR